MMFRKSDSLALPEIFCFCRPASSSFLDKEHGSVFSIPLNVRDKISLGIDGFREKPGQK
jgi:hypothetical protein